MRISLYKDLKVIDAGTERNIAPIISQIQINEPNVVLDFCDCGVDYPATSKIIDKILFELAKLTGKKSLTIIFDFRITDLALHKWFFIGSTFFNIPEENNDMKNEDFQTIIKEKTIQNSIALTIEIHQEGNTIFKRLEYGNN